MEKKVVKFDLIISWMKVEKYFKNKSVDINARQHASLRKRNFKREPDRITLIARKKLSVV